MLSRTCGTVTALPAWAGWKKVSQRTDERSNWIPSRLIAHMCYEAVIWFLRDWDRCIDTLPQCS